jgi:hypothetical protein
MPLPALPPNPLLDSLARYPHWFVAACLTIVIAAVLWVLAKLMQWGLQLLVGLVLFCGAAATIWLLFH